MGLKMYKREVFKKRKSMREKGGFSLGYPHSTPDCDAVKVMSNFLQYNSNHIGAISNLKKNLTYTRRKEIEAVQTLGQLYGLDVCDGYITSGGTEGNIMGVWLCRSMIGCNERFALITSENAHYSVDKAVKLQQIKYFEKIKNTINEEIDTALLESKIIKMIKSNEIRYFGIVLTSGYTTTGTQDNIKKVEQIIDKIKRTYNISVFIHIDAAIGGLFYPFFPGYCKYFDNKYVVSVSVDPHKLGYMPIGTGVFICRENFLKYICTDIPYTSMQDNTLIGSRNGANSVALWTILNKQGYMGHKNQLIKLLKMKKQAITILEELKDVEVIDTSKMNMFCFMINKGKKKLPKVIEHKYCLDLFKRRIEGKETYCYKIYIMWHTTYSVIKQLKKDIKSYAEVISENRKGSHSYKD